MITHDHESIPGKGRGVQDCNNILEQRIASAKTHNTSMVLILLRSFCRELSGQIVLTSLKNDLKSVLH